MNKRVKSKQAAIEEIALQMEAPIEGAAQGSTRTTVRLDPSTVDILEELKNLNNLKFRETISIAVDTFWQDQILTKYTEVDLDIFDLTVRKSIVLSSDALRKLNKTTKKMNNSSRDSLLNLFVHLIHHKLKIVERDRPKHLKTILSALREIWSASETLENEAKDLLGEDDAVKWRLGTISVVAMNLVSALENEIDGGAPVDPDEM